MSKFFHRFVAGFFMGIAEITPGISGATIAGLFNVYKNFLSSLTAFNPNLRNFSIEKFFHKLNPNFIFPLFMGMIIAIYIASFLIDFLIINYLIAFKVFLTFVMLAAVIKNIFFDHKWAETRGYSISFFIGFCVALLISMSLVSLNFDNYFLLGIAGFFAFSAFLLPGISGSLVLVMLGVYPLVIKSVKMLDLMAILPLLVGFMVSFLLLPKEIIKSFNRNEQKIKMLFSGLISGSISAVWIHLN